MHVGSPRAGDDVEDHARLDLPAGRGQPEREPGTDKVPEVGGQTLEAGAHRLELRVVDEGRRPPAERQPEAMGPGAVSLEGQRAIGSGRLAVHDMAEIGEERGRGPGAVRVEGPKRRPCLGAEAEAQVEPREVGDRRRPRIVELPDDTAPEGRELRGEGLPVRPGRKIERLVGDAGVGGGRRQPGADAGAVAVVDRHRLDLVLPAQDRRVRGDVAARRRPRRRPLVTGSAR